MNNQSLTTAFADLQDFISVLEDGYHPTGPLSFLTAITERSIVDHNTVACVDRIGISVASVGWGPEGLIIDFKTKEDLSLFALAYDGARPELNNG